MLNDSNSLPLPHHAPASVRARVIGRFLLPTGRLRPSAAVALFFFLVGDLELVLGLPGHLAVGMTHDVSLDDWRLALLGLPGFAATVLATWFFLRRGMVEAFTEPAESSAWRAAANGLGFGALAMLVAAAVPVLAGFGTLQPSSVGLSALVSAALLNLVVIAPMAIGEELLFRGVAFQVLRRASGRPGFVIAGTSLLFGVAHLANAHASMMAAANVALAGAWLGVLAWRRSLWASMGAHAAWNTVQGFVMGQPVSGFQPGASLLQGTWSLERGLWSGGSFGPEASGWTTVVLLTCLLFALLTKRPKVTVGSSPKPCH